MGDGVYVMLYGDVVCAACVAVEVSHIFSARLFRFKAVEMVVRKMN